MDPTNKTTTSERIKGRAFFHSVHASLEWDMANIFKHLGITIAKANMDRSYAERPELLGYTGIDWGDEMRNRVDNLACNKEDFDGCDFAFIMNPSDFHWRVEHFSRFVPTVAYVNGQWLENQLDEFAGKMNKQWDAQSEPRTSEKCNIWVAVYTKHEEEYLRKRVHTQLQDRIHHIRFCKRIEDYYNPKAPRDAEFIYTTCNDIHNRGDSCYWKQWQETVMGPSPLPHILSGRNTNEVAGHGLISFDQLQFNMSHCSGYLGVPCYPAPLVLNVVEAMCAGAPVAFYDNQRGIKGEGIFEGVGCLSDNTGTLRNFLKRCLDDNPFREDQAAKSLARAKELFAFETQVEKWRVLFSQMAKLWT